VRLAVVGSPVVHSLSPAIHTAALRACGIAGSYEAIECDADGFADVMRSIRRGDLDGCNVTMPHKRLAHDLVDRRSDHAERAGAVNTVVRLGERLVGHNTDVVGIVAAARRAELPAEGPVLVLGAGGGAAAALLAFEGRPLSISARRSAAAVALAEAVGVDADVVEFGTAVVDATVVNATPIGMSGEELPVPVLESAAALLEMPYAAGTTPATLAMRQQGKPVAEGVEMLIGQAVESFRLWTGCAVPADVVRETLQALRDR
jgi:shikimate dehydrogenase